MAEGSRAGNLADAGSGARAAHLGDAGGELGREQSVVGRLGCELAEGSHVYSRGGQAAGLEVGPVALNGRFREAIRPGGDAPSEKLREPRSYARRLQASKEQLADALSGQFSEAQRLVLKLYLEQIDVIERHMAELDGSLAKALTPHQDAIERPGEIPGIGVRTAQHIVAETGPGAEVFESAGKLASWAGCAQASRRVQGFPSAAVRQRELDA